METPLPQDLEELARTQRDALEAALKEMVNSGFGDLDAQRPPSTPEAPPPAQAAGSMLLGWW